MATIPNGASLISIAREEIGVREGRSSNGTWNNRVKYNDWYVDVMKKGEVYRDAAWCAIFVSWCANKASISPDVIPVHAYTPSGWNWFKSRKLNVDSPQSGDIMYVFYPSQGVIGHVGIVERRDGDYIYTIEGNTNITGSSQGNGVYRLRRKINENLHFARPSYSTGLVPTPVPTVTTSPATGISRPPISSEKPYLVSAVSVTHLKQARYEDPPKSGTPLGPYANEVYTMEVALSKTQWILPQYVDGHFGSSTVGDGSSGYGGTTGFQKKHSGTVRPDGWLGAKELRLLFSLAQMSVQVNG